MLRADGSLAAASLLDEDTRRAFEDFQQTFGADEVLLVTLHDAGERPLFSPGSLRALRNLTADLAAHEEVSDVVSLVSLEDFSVVSVFGRQAPTPPRPLIPSGDRLDAEAEQRLRADPFLATGILAEDGRTTAAWVLLDPELRQRPDYLERVLEIAASVPRKIPGQPNLTVSVTGFPLLRGALRQLFLFHGLGVTVLAVLGVALVAALVGVAWRAILAWALSWPALAGVLVTGLNLGGRGPHLFTPNLLPLLVVTGGALLLHLGTRRGSSRATLHAVWRICAWSATTTAIGFLCLSGTALPALESFALEAALGAIAAFAVASGFLRLAPGALVAEARRRRTPRMTSRPATVLAAIAILAGLPWFLIQPDRLGSVGDLVGYLPDDHPRAVETRRARDAMQALLGIEIILRLPEAPPGEERVLDEDFLLGILAFENAVKEAAGPDLPRLFGAGALMKYLNTRMQRADPETMLDAWKVGPETARFAGRFLLGPYLDLARREGPKSALVLALEERLGQLLSADGTRLRWHGRLAEPSPALILALQERLRPVLEREAARLGAEGADVTGSSIAFARTTEAVRDTQMRALLQGAIGLGLFLVLALRSLRLGALAVLVSAAAVVVTLNGLWLLRAELNLYSTVLTATVLGVIVDDTLHLLAVRRRAGGSSSWRTRVALARAGWPILATSLAMMAAFAAFAVSPLPLYRQFALTGIAAVVAALVFDLVVVTVLMGWRRRSS